MATASKVVSIAAGQVGYKEGKNNSNKYGAAYGMNNVSWCMEFIWWCFKQAGMDWYKTASCMQLKRRSPRSKKKSPVQNLLRQ